MQQTNGHRHMADGAKRLTTIPDVTTTGAHIPYKVSFRQLLLAVTFFLMILC